MINLFQIAPQDQSLYYLSQIFGGMGTVLAPAGGVPSTISLLGTLFKLFNSVILAIGALVLVYTTVVGVMTTAAEGEFLGKKFHGLWTPLRSVIGIAALIPTPSGYSAIQLIMMWVILQGVGAADVIWNQTISFVNLMGSPYVKATIPALGATKTMQDLFQSLVCQSTARIDRTRQGIFAKDNNYYCQANPNNIFCRQENTNLWDINTRSVVTDVGEVEVTNPDGSKSKVKKRISKYLIGPEQGQCGTLTYCNLTNMISGTPEYLACQAQIEGLRSLVLTVLGPLSAQVAEKDYDYWQYYTVLGQIPPELASRPDFKAPKPPEWLGAYCTATGKCTATALPRPYATRPGGTEIDRANVPEEVLKEIYWPYGIKTLVSDSDFIKTTTNQGYIMPITTALNTLITQAQQQEYLPTELQNARNFGWIFAGAYYYVLAQKNDSNMAAANPVFEVTSAGPIPGKQNVLTNFRNNYIAALTLINLAKTNSSDSGGAGGGISNSGTFAASPELGQLGSTLGVAANGIMSSFMNTITGARPGEMAVNPLASVQSLGRALIITVEVFFAVFIALALLLLALGYINVSVLGTFVLNPVGPVMSTSFLFLIPIILGFMGAFFSFGGLLAVYTPLIPYVIFTMGAIGWFIATIETMVAAPLVALGILSPGGQHEIMGKAEPALMLLFGVFLRPMLMIFGMMAAMLLSAVVVTMINAGFKSVMGNISSVPGLLELTLFMAAYVFLIIAALNKCFSLIHVIPERVLAVFGHRGESYGEEQALSETKRGVEGAASGAGAAAGAPAGMGEKGVKASGQYKKEEAKKKQDTSGPNIEGQ